ncbi:MAG: flagellar hook-basal body complex protein FliE [Oscillospiraceae bacterium]|jgi:flagellar hook-basal body complex protein FliE|nr:flagellar hook-basal body complex protein FliE [Oscillospiraceae bacterium]
MDPLKQLGSIGSYNNVFGAAKAALPEQEEPNVSFLDVLKNVIADAVAANKQSDEDAIQLALGNVDDIERIQANIAKAEVATELLVNVKNTVVDAYNEVFRMSV